MTSYADYQYWLSRLLRVLNLRLKMLDGPNPLIEESIRDARGLLRFLELTQQRPATEAKLLDFMCRVSDVTRKVDDILEKWNAG